MIHQTTSCIPGRKLAEESNAIKVLARGNYGVADMFAYQAGTADYQNIFGGGHGWCLVVEWR
jgi:hypothetical protein